MLKRLVDTKPSLDLSRQSGQLDSQMLSAAVITVIGSSRSRLLAEFLAASGVRRFHLVDPGVYEPENVSQCGIACHEVGKRKVDCVARSIRKINPAARVKTHFKRHNELPDLGRLFQNSSLVIDGTDSLAVARELSQTGLRTCVDTLHLKTGGDNQQFMLTGTIAREGGGWCIRCIHKSACDAIDAGHQPAPFYHSHRVVPEGLNVKAAWVALGLLHLNIGSDLPIAEVGRHFNQFPAWIGFNGIAPGGEIFPIRAWREPLPPGWTCPDCGATAE